MKSGFKLGLVTLPLAAIGVAVLAFVVVTSPPPEQVPLSERVTPVRVIVAENQFITPTISGFGLVAPSRTFDAIAQVAGTVVYLNPMLIEGEILPANAVLLRLSQEDTNLAIAQAQANIRAAQAKLAELTVSEKNQTAALAIEKETLNLKKSDFERVEALQIGGTVSRSTLDNVRSAYLGQRQKVLSVESNLALLPTQRAVQQEQVAVYQANLATAKLNLERTEFRLPFAARVVSTSVEIGQFVRVGQSIATLDGIEIAEVEAQISVGALRTLLQNTHPDVSVIALDPTQMTRIFRSLNLAVEVQLSLGSDLIVWPARVDRINSGIDPKTGSLGVIVQVDTAYSGALPGDRPPLTKGMFVEVTISAEPIEGIVVPRSAIRDGNVLIVGEGDRLALVPVDPYLVQNDIALVTEGLEQGQKVVVSDLSPIISEMLLLAVEDENLINRLTGRSAPK